MSKFECEVLEVEGVCNNEIFRKMMKKGDVTSEKIIDNLNKKIKILGCAKCHITVEDKEFDMCYYATNEGILNSGSEILYNSIIDYIVDGHKDFKIVEVKTKKGKTYKASPIFSLYIDEASGEIIE